MASFVECGKAGYVRCVEDGCVVVDDPAVRMMHGAAVAQKAASIKAAGRSTDPASLVSAQGELMRAQAAEIERLRAQLAKPAAPKPEK